MKQIWFTSDNHFFHKSILKFARETRQGNTVDEMNELMIEKWNETVALYDDVYSLGDFSFGSARKTIEVLKRLKGRIHLIRGNHDHWIDQGSEGREAAGFFEWIRDYKRASFADVETVMFHYPIFEWEKMHYGSFHLYGHVHGNTVVPGRALDVGIDARPQKDMGLWNFDEIRQLLSQREVRAHHGRTATSEASS